MTSSSEVPGFYKKKPSERLDYVKKFANLLEQLLFTYSTNRKIEILATYLKSLNYKEKGITIAVLTGNLNFKNINRSNILNIVKRNPFILN